MNRPSKNLTEDKARTVRVSAELYSKLMRYAVAEGTTVDAAARQFIRDGLEAA